MIKFPKVLFCLLLAVTFALNSFTVMAEEQIPTKTVINFDDKVEYPLERSDAMEISLAPERDGKSTKALHILGGEYSADLTLNETIICGSPSDNYATKNTDGVFGVPVKAETLYKFTCYAYLKAGGEWTVVVTNYNFDEIPVHINFGKALKRKNFYRHLYESSNVIPTPDAEIIGISAVANRVTSGFYDTNPAHSVAVYTSQRD